MKRFVALALSLLFSACNCGRDPVPLCPDGDDLEVPTEQWVHVPEGSAIVYQHNPPASGPHYPVWAKLGAYTQTVPRGYWMHNVEHGAVVFLHRPDAPEERIQLLRETFAKLPNDPFCGTPRAILTPDPEMEVEVAIVAANHVLRGDCLDEAAILAFVEARRGKGPENVCLDGNYAPP